MMLFRDAPAAIRDEGVDSLIVDQIEMAGGTVAEHLGLPFVSVAAALPINLDASVPPVNFPWSHRTGVRARLRNWVGNAACEWIFSGVVRTINRQRRAWGLPPARDFNALFSGLAQVVATARRPGAAGPPPAAPLPPHRPLDGRGGAGAGGLPLVPPRPGPAPGVRLDGDAPERGPPDLPGDRRGVRGAGPAIGDLAGRRAGPGAARGPPGDPVVVGYAPQLELIRRSALTISHGGLNTALESLARGVPMVVLPVAYDQPGVGARVEWSGVGRSIPVGRLTVDRLRDAVRVVLGDPAYRERAGRLRSSIEAADGLNRAADLIEGAFGTGWRAVPSEVGRHARAGSHRPQDLR